MAFLKFIVIGLGLLILAGVFLLGYGFYKTSSDSNWKFSPSRANVQTTKLATTLQSTYSRKSFGNINLKINANCLIIDIKEFRDLFIIRTGDAPVCQKIFVFNLKDFSLLGTISTNQ